MHWAGLLELYYLQEFSYPNTPLYTVSDILARRLDELNDLGGLFSYFKYQFYFIATIHRQTWE